MAGVKVVEVGAIGRGVSADEYRAQLERWSREAEERGAVDEAMSPEEIDAEASRGDHIVSVAVEEFAVLEDGCRVVTDERHGNCAIDFMGFAGALVGDGTAPLSERLDLRPTVSMLAADIEELIRGDPDDETRWGRLIAALDENGIRVTVRDLDSLPFSVHLAPELRRRLKE